MATRSKPRPSEAERAERRQRDRERVRVATRELLTSEGWQRWVRARAVFHGYSSSNCMLLALQCHQRGIEPRHVAGFRAWQRLGRAVAKGQCALWVMAPMTVKEQDARGEATLERRLFFRSVPVFEFSQTEVLPGVEPAPLEPPSAPIEGDSHGHLLEPLAALAGELGYSMSFAELGGERGGFCDYRSQRIVIEARQSSNAKVRVAVHELAHAMGVSSQRFGREQAEVIVECGAFVCCSGLGLATDAASIPYLAGWGEDGALEAVTEAAELIDRIAKRIEDAVGLHPDSDAGEDDQAALSIAAATS
jgi:antirestriction protein ArdC